jgi:hypothetical protein
LNTCILFIPFSKTIRSRYALFGVSAQLFTQAPHKKTDGKIHGKFIVDQNKHPFIIEELLGATQYYFQQLPLRDVIQRHVECGEGQEGIELESSNK